MPGRQEYDVAIALDVIEHMPVEDGHKLIAAMTRHLKPTGMLIIGRSAGVSESDRARLKWRTEKVRIDSHSIDCLTFDDLYEYLV